MTWWKSALRFVFTVGGYIVGSFLGAPGLGAFVGATIGSLLFPYDKQQITGPRLDGIQIQSSAYGQPIYKLYGTMRLAGNVIHIAPIKETVTEKEHDGAVEKTYHYFATLAIGLCEGPIDKIIRIWADSQLIASLAPSKRDSLRITRNKGYELTTIVRGLNYRVYQGTETQTASKWLEEVDGAGNVPPYKGLAYIVFKDFPLEQFGNNIPNFTFEVSKETVETAPSIEIQDIEATIFGSDNIVFNPDGLFITIYAGGYWNKINTITNTLVIETSYLLPGGNPEIADGIGDFDIDERNIIHTSKYSATPNYSYFCQLDGDTFEERGVSSSDDYYSPTYIRVFRNPEHPYLVAISSGGDHLYITPRDSYSFDGVTDLIDIEPESGQHNFVSIALDHTNGVVWALMKSWTNSPSDPETFVAQVIPTISGGYTVAYWEVTSDIEYGAEIIYDEATDQIIIGSANHNGVQKIAFFDASASDLTLLGEIEENGAFPAYHKSVWQRGAINGYIYYTYSNNTISRIDIEEYTIDKTWTASPAPGNWNGGSIYDPLTHSVFAACLGLDFSYAKILLERSVPVSALLGDVVTDLCEAVGLDGGTDLDVSELTDDVRGYLINERMTARAAIQTLMNAFFFDGVESDGILKFPKRGAASIASIPETDLAAYLDGEDRPQKMVSTRTQELELPKRLEVSYADIDADYEVGTQYEERLTTQSEEMAEVRIPIALDKDEAKQIAVKHLGLVWHSRTTRTFSLPYEYITLDATDVITVTKGGQEYNLRIQKITPAIGVLNLETVDDDADLYISDAEGSAPTTRYDDISYAGPTYLVLIDAPLIDSTKNETGIWVATLGYLDFWSGAEIYKSIDGGSTWGSFTSSIRDAVITKATDTLGDVADPWVWDEGNTLNVRMLDPGDSLSSATRAEVLDGANVGYCGSEFIQWRTATLETNGSYTISGLLRGRYGTEWATGLHEASETLVVIDTTKMHFVPMDIIEKDAARDYRAISIGDTTRMAFETDLTALFRNMMPWSPQHIEGTRDGSGNLTITWIRRTRFGGEWQDGGAPSLGETTEAYEIDIYDGSTIVRTLTVTSETASYTAAEQVTDFGSIQSSIDIEVFQISSVVDRGFGTTATV